jgi:hypothetical protein
MSSEVQAFEPDGVNSVVTALKGILGFIIGFILGAGICGILIAALVVGSIYVLPLSGPDYVFIRNMMFGASVGAGIAMGGWMSKRFRKKKEGSVGRKKKSLTENSSAIELCTTQIAGSWLHYNKVLKFKQNVTWGEILNGFAIPMCEFVKNNHPTVYAGGPDLFLHVLYSGVRLTQWPSPTEIEVAIKESDAELNAMFCTTPH